MNAAPTEIKERVLALDMMRGFALLGIFIVNMLAFHSPFYYINPYTWFTSPSDADAFSWIDIFLQASVYPLFSILFGYGLAMQFRKSNERGASFTKLAVRRMTVLLIIGILHAFLVWSGDILITYAISGFILMWMLRISRIYLMLIALVLYLLPNIGLAFITYLLSAAGEDYYASVEGIEASIKAFGSGSWAEIFSQRAADWSYANLESGALFLIVITILPFMLIGAAAAKANLVERIAEKKVFWAILTVSSLALGFYLKWMPYTGKPDFFTMFVQDSFGGPLVAIGYAGLIGLVCQLAFFRKLFHPIAKAGRMSMTVYLLQSIIATTIFYSYGFDLYGKVDLETGTWMAVGIFAILVIFAEIWFAKFSQGPVEAFWKRLTYGKQP